MKTIHLTQGEVAIVSPEDFDRLSQHKWLLVRNGVRRKHLYAARHDSITNRRIYMHREVAGVDGLLVDHINGNGLDNRRENLRPATASQNSLNRKGPAKTGTGVRSVFKHQGGFVVRTARENIKFHLGWYPTVEEAAAARARFDAAGNDFETIARVISLDALAASLERRLAAIATERAILAGGVK